MGGIAVGIIEELSRKKAVSWTGVAASVAKPFLVPVMADAGHWVRDQYVMGHLGYDLLPTSHEHKHPATIGMPISHERSSGSKFWGNCFKWACRIGGVALAIALAPATGGGSLVVAAGVMAATVATGLAVGELAGDMGATLIETATENVAVKTGEIIEGSPNVFFNGQNAARMGDRVLCNEHPEWDDNRLIEGSKTVFINNLPMVRVGHEAACGAFVSEGVNYAYTGLLTTRIPQDAGFWSYETWNKGFDTVETVYEWFSLGVSVGGLTGGLMKISRRGWLRVLANLKRPDRFIRHRARRWQQHTRSFFRRKTASDPVDVVTGEFVENCVDFTIEATIPLEAARFFSSHYYFSTEIGHGRISNFDAHIIQLDEENYCLFKGSGQLVPFSLPLAHKGPARSRDFPNFVFMRDNLGRLLIIEERKCSFFQKFQDDTMFFLARIEDLNDNSITFKRDLAGVLHRLEHSDGFELHFSNDEAGRRLGISWHGEGEVLPLVTYAYDASGNLTQVTCMGGISYQYSYNDKGQLCSWQDRSKLTHVTLHYDEEDRVVHLQSTGAWDEDRFEYDDEARLTRYIDGKSGAVECYTYDENLNITCHHHANGHETSYEYAVLLLAFYYILIVKNQKFERWNIIFILNGLYFKRDIFS